ncbi:MAG: hypothetical protein O2986_10360 [Actinomycetota bacterium]|nr:hypothetical protein [Ilumatobacteraceae bacterium]MDA2974936.1 hypothetical protein [Actinomycetota bacterium]
MGERLGHVINMTDIDPNARAYRRNDELTPHTDPADVLTEQYRLDARTAYLLTERLIALVTIFAGAPTAVSPDPIDLAAHIDLEVRILTALANESAQDSST